MSRAGSVRRFARSWTTAFITSVAVLVAVFLTAAGIFAFLPNGDDVVASFIHAQPGSVRWNSSERLNMLVMGMPGGVRKGAPTNLMMVVSLDQASRTVQIMPIPSNLWVTIPGYGPGTIAEAYEDGGPRLALLVAQGVLRVPIEYYAVMGTDTVSQIVDAFGGIAVDGHRASASMTGAAAVSYLLRGLGGSPASASAMRREVAVVSALKRQLARPEALLKVPALLNAVGGTVLTNFPYDQVPELTRLLVGVPVTHVRSANLDFSSGAVSSYTASGTSIALPDLQRIRMVARAAFGDPTLTRDAKVWVLNGSGISGAASGLADWLRQSRVPVAGFGSASSFNYLHTEVMIRAAAGQTAWRTARAVSTLLQAPLVTGRVDNSRAPVVVIIGGDYQDPTQQ